MEKINFTSDAASWQNNFDGLDIDQEVDFYSELFQPEDSLSLEFLSNSKNIENNLKYFQEEGNSKVDNNNNNYTVENQYINEISPYLADSSNGLDLIDYLEENSPTPSSTTSSIEQILNEFTGEDFAKVQSNNLQITQTVADQQSLQTLIPNPADNTESTIINDKTLAVMIQEDFWNFVPKQSSTINELTTPTSSDKFQSQHAGNGELISDIKAGYNTTIKDCLSNEINESGKKPLLSTLPSHSLSEVKSKKETKLSTRRERNNKASKKIRLKQKQKEKDLNMQESTLKKQKQHREREVVALESKIATTYKFLKMDIKHSAQDNPSKYIQRLLAVLKKHEKSKRDPVCNKVSKKALKYFEQASELYISQEQQVEVMGVLQRQQQQSL